MKFHKGGKHYIELQMWWPQIHTGPSRLYHLHRCAGVGRCRCWKRTEDLPQQSLYSSDMSPWFSESTSTETRAEGHPSKAKKDNQYPSAAQPCSWEDRGMSMFVAASLQADAEAIIQLGNREFWAAYSPLFQRVCQCLYCFTLCFPQRSWINITSPPQGITALVSLSLFIADATEVLLCIWTLWGWPNAGDFACALNGSNWLRSVPWHKDGSSWDFSGLGTLRKGNILKHPFCFPAGAVYSLRRGYESSVCEGWGWVPRTAETTAGQSSAQRQNQAISCGHHFLAVTGRWQVVQWGTAITLGLYKG